MNETTLRNYAELIARVGVNVQNGQPVVIQAELDQPDFVTMLVEACYRAGASEVAVEWNHQPLTRLNVEFQAPEVLGRVKAWQELRLRHRAETLPAMIYLMSEDPDGLSGMDQAKYAAAIQARQKIIKPIRDTMENKYQWCIAAVPGRGWAEKVFPGLSPARAEERLWEAILYTSRADGADPAAAWQAHNADLKARCAHLNALGLAALEYKASNGTDLHVGLIPDARFLGGSEQALGSGVEFQPNIPSEEVFTSPMRGSAEGIVVASRPLSFRGVLIEDFSIRFRDGRAVEARAGKNEDALHALLSMDEGASMLGECAFVPYDSPIRNAGILFYNTLFDENAACHLALGKGFSNCLEHFEHCSLDECRAKGINDSMVHEDFMIGTEDLAVTGITAEGRPVPLFRNGNWAF